ncbi:uncharacterized protein LOC112491054 [Ziziphus jujuba]|uniref:Uncharacterized protein LOC112491054 n=1 Tax=Ziziphus jujuba TaxID=326968 RepID=A0A6P6G222_ZIZJJ|nr:uncharacterized protein LOC112491054 [Ziziphus jujuba]
MPNLLGVLWDDTQMILPEHAIPYHRKRYARMLNFSCWINQLNQNNNIIWRSQILPAITGCNMEGFIDGTLQAPPLTSVVNTTSDGLPVSVAAPNSTFHQWRRDYKLVVQ